MDEQGTSLIPLFLKSIDSDHTRRAYRTDLKDYFRRSDDEDLDARIKRTRKSDIQDYIHGLQKENLSESTTRRRLSALRRFYDWLLNRGLVDSNPARDVHLDQVRGLESTDETSNDSKPLTKAEVETLLQATADAGTASTRDWGLLLTILYGALRRSEVAGMNVEHVRPIGRHWVIDLPSGSSGASAYVKIPDLVVEAIDAVRDRYGIDQGPLWRSLSNRNRGARMSPDAIYKVVRRTAQRAGLDRVTVDAVRQTGLQLAHEAGATMHQLQLHGRLKSASSVERYMDSNEDAGRLNDSAADFLTLDLSIEDDGS